VHTVVFDKTGTLTAGRPAVVDCAVWQQGVGAGDALLLAAAVEANSEHPLAAAIVAHVRHGHEKQGADAPQQEDGAKQLEAATGGSADVAAAAAAVLPPCRDVEVAVGQGISGLVQLPGSCAGGAGQLQAPDALHALCHQPASAAAHGQEGAAAGARLPAVELRVLVGSPRFLAAAGVSVPPAAERYMREQEGLGRTVVLVAAGGCLLAAAAVQDPLKPEAR
jgi:cation transport ATPase